VRDGEGVHRVVTVRVNGAKTIQDADAAARAVANSALVKTSWHGGDPNWGRIIDALGYSPAKIVEEKIDIGYSALAAKNSVEPEARAADEGDVQATCAPPSRRRNLICTST
jgi:glutamate N-acetyltransferase / amino-acid N-acetyltransferase